MNSNRDKGHSYERSIAQWFRNLGFKCTTSRYSSREKDDAKIDLCGTSPFSVQCKNSDRLSNYHTVLDEIGDEPGHYKILMHKRTRKGTVVAMRLETFEELIKLMIANGVIKVEK